jgi:hypothetical protein
MANQNPHTERLQQLEARLQALDSGPKTLEAYNEATRLRIEIQALKRDIRRSNR